MSQTVVDIPGLPDGVEVRRSTRRRRSVTALREGGRIIVVVPARMSRSDIKPFVDELVGRLAEREKRGRRTDGELHARATELAHRYLEGTAVPSSVRWVTNQRRRWGSCTPSDSTIRLSDRLARMPAHVIDYVLLHELVHLLVPGHGADFEAYMLRYPRLLEARAFLAGVDHATGHGLDNTSDDNDIDGDTDGDTDSDSDTDTDTDSDIDGEGAGDRVGDGRAVDVDPVSPPRLDDNHETERLAQVVARPAARRSRHEPGPGADPLF